MARYIEPQDIERVYQELIAYYRDADRKHSEQRPSSGRVNASKRSSQRLVKRNSLPFTPNANITVSYDNEKQEVVLSHKKRS